MPKGTPVKGYQNTKERQRILNLLRHNGPVCDEDGRATEALRQLTGHKTTNALSAVLKPMEEVGLIRREINGRRCFLIEASPVRESTAPLSHEPAPAESAVSAMPATTGSIDYELLAGIMLKKAVSALDAPSYQHEIRELQADLAHVAAELESLRAERTTLEEQLRIAKNNAEVLQKELSRSQRSARSGVAVREHLDEDERKALDQLMRSLPTTRGN